MHRFQVFLQFFQESKQRERSMLDGTKTQSDSRNTEAALQQDG